MLRCLPFAIALMSAHAAAPPSPPKNAPTPALTPEQEVTQFRHDEINLLALRADARSLAAAALMANADAADPHRPGALKPPALLERAQKAAPDDVLVWWATATLECHGNEKPCPQGETLQKLETLDAQNAAMWTFSVVRAQRSGDAPAARAALTSAGQAQRYEDYFGKVIGMVEEAENILPVSDEVIRASGQINASPEGYRLISAAGIAASTFPPLQKALETACADGETDADVRADCTSVARKMAASGSLGARGFGVAHLLAWLPAGADRDAARLREHALGWHTQSIGELAERLAGDPQITRIYVDELRATGSESAAVLAVLHSQGVALEPPADWRPPHADGSNPP